MRSFLGLCHGAEVGNGPYPGLLRRPPHRARPCGHHTTKAGNSGGSCGRRGCCGGNHGHEGSRIEGGGSLQGGSRRSLLGWGRGRGRGQRMAGVGPGPGRWRRIHRDKQQPLKQSVAMAYAECLPRCQSEEADHGEGGEDAAAKGEGDKSTNVRANKDGWYGLLVSS